MNKTNSDDPHKKAILEDHNIDRLIKAAGPKPMVCNQRRARAFTAVHSAWQESLAGTAAKSKPAPQFSFTRLAWVSAACFLLIFSGVFFVSNQGRPGEVFVARVDKLKGDVNRRIGPQATEILLGSPLFSGQTLETLGGSGLALRFSLGQSLRMDQNTRLRFLSVNELELIQGAIYFDSGIKDNTPALKVHTPYGIVSDIGTQFEVRLTRQDIGVKVREGEVELNADSGITRTLKSTEKLQLLKGGKATISHIAPDSLEWQWTQSLAPLFEFEGNSLDYFLNLFARENGWGLQYSTSALEHYAAETMLHGTIADMDNDEILQTVSVIGDIDYEVKNWVLFIHPKKNVRTESD